MEETTQSIGSIIWRFVRKHWAQELFLIAAAALVITVSSLHDANREQLTLREQVERQNELIAALKDQQKEEENKEVHVVVTSDTIEQQLNSVRELVTQEYIYTNADKKESSEPWIFGWERPFSGKSILVTYDGVIKAGVDLSQAAIEVDEEKRAVTITLPPSKITVNSIPQESINVVEVKNGLFNDVTLENYNDFISEQKTVMEQKAIDQGILTRADEEARALIKSVLSVLPGMDGYTLTIRQSG